MDEGVDQKRDKPRAPIGIGCVPGFVFGVVVGLPAFIGSVLGDCFDVGRGCPNKDRVLFENFAVIAALCLVITWATNWMIDRFARHGRPAHEGVAGGCLLGILLILILNALLMTSS